MAKRMEGVGVEHRVRNTEYILGYDGGQEHSVPSTSGACGVTVSPSIQHDLIDAFSMLERDRAGGGESRVAERHRRLVLDMAGMLFGVTSTASYGAVERELKRLISANVR